MGKRSRRRRRFALARRYFNTDMAYVALDAANIASKCRRRRYAGVGRIEKKGLQLRYRLKQLLLTMQAGAAAVRAGYTM